MIKRIETEQKSENTSVSARIIVSDLRRKIVKGEWEPGMQVPTRSEIETQFGASRVTVQRALDELRREGWVAVNGRRGTYVSPQPPHLTRYALVFPYDTNLERSPAWVRFWTALIAEARALESSGDISVSSYFGVDGHEDSEDFQRLVREVQGNRVAGLIFATSPFLVRGTPLMNEPNVPRVAIMSLDGVQPIPAVNPDTSSFWARALDYVASKGKKRVAFLTTPRSKMEQYFTEPMLRQHGLETHPYWHQIASQNSSESAINTIHLLMHAGQNERPDALIISDDNLVEHAAAGLIAAGVRVPEEIEVVAHCNFPHPTYSPLPFKRLGYDARQVLQACLNNIDGQRRGQAVPMAIRIPALFEEEIESRAVSD